MKWFLKPKLKPKCFYWIGFQAAVAAVGGRRGSGCESESGPLAVEAVVAPVGRSKKEVKSLNMYLRQHAVVTRVVASGLDFNEKPALGKNWHFGRKRISAERDNFGRNSFLSVPFKTILRPFLAARAEILLLASCGSFSCLWVPFGFRPKLPFSEPPILILAKTFWLNSTLDTHIGQKLTCNRSGIESEAGGGGKSIRGSKQFMTWFCCCTCAPPATEDLFRPKVL